MDEEAEKFSKALKETVKEDPFIRLVFFIEVVGERYPDFKKIVSKKLTEVSYILDSNKNSPHLIRTMIIQSGIADIIEEAKQLGTNPHFKAESFTVDDWPSLLLCIEDI